MASSLQMQVSNEGRVTYYRHRYISGNLINTNDAYVPEAGESAADPIIIPDDDEPPTVDPSVNALNPNRQRRLLEQPAMMVNHGRVTSWFLPGVWVRDLHINGQNRKGARVGVVSYARNIEVYTYIYNKERMADGRVSVAMHIHFIQSRGGSVPRWLRQQDHIFNNLMYIEMGAPFIDGMSTEEIVMAGTAAIENA